MEKMSDKTAGFGRVIETYPYPDDSYRVLIESESMSCEAMVPAAFARDLKPGQFVRVGLRLATNQEEAELAKSEEAPSA